MVLDCPPILSAGIAAGGAVQVDRHALALRVTQLDLKDRTTPRGAPCAQHLTQTLHESSSAAVLDGDEIVYVLRVPAHKIMSINLGVGSRLPAHCSSMGRVLLAGLPEDERERRVMAMHLTAKTPKTITDPERLLSVLGDVRRKGFALVSEELELGLMSLAVPVMDRAGRVVAALNVSTQPQRRTATELREQCLPLLQAVARRIGETMAR